MVAVDSLDETRQEEECFAQVVERALKLDEVRTPLEGFPPNERQNVAVAVERERESIWLRAAPLRRRVRELEVRLQRIEDRIGAADPVVTAASADVEREYLRLVGAWDTLRPEAERLGLSAMEPDPATALATIRAEIEKAKRSQIPVPEAASLGAAPPVAGRDEGGPSTDSPAGTAAKASGRQRLRERLTRLQLDAGQGSTGARLAALLLVLLGARDLSERIRQALSGLQRDITNLSTAVQEQAPVIAQQAAEAAQRDTAHVTATSELNEAWRRLEDGLLNDGVLDTLRRALNNAMQDLYTTHMPVVAAPALSDPVALDKPVETPAIREVRRLLGRMRGISVGVAGPRGAGKSTLIDAFCSGAAAPPEEDAAESRTWLGLRVAAPVEYEPRDFILYLFGELCRRVPGVQGDEDTDPAASEERVSPSPLRIFLAAALAAAVLSLGVAARLIAELLHDHTSLWPLISVSLGVVLVLLALMMSYGRRVLRPPFRRDPFIDDQSAPPEIRRRMQEAYSFRLRVQAGRNLLRARLFALCSLAAAGALAVTEPALSPALPGYFLIGIVALGASGPIAAAASAISYQPFPLNAAPAPAKTRYQLARMLTQVGIGIAIIICAFGICAIALAFVGTNWALTIAAALALILAGCWALVVPLLYSGIQAWLPSEEIFDYPPGPSGREEEIDLVGFVRTNLLGVLYQKTISRNWSGTVHLTPAHLGIGTDSQWSRGASWARQPQTYPELVRRFQELVMSIARQYRVIIGIDELDKIESGVKAEQFLNDIKGIFGLRESYFLVSVSEDAAASFQRRGVPFRDVFDSCFDTVITVGHLDYASAKQLLYSLVIGWPMPFIALCYVVSGGLARDLKRAARIVNQQTQDTISLSAAARQLCREEANAKTQGLQHQLICAVGDEFSDDLLAMLAPMRNDTVETADPTTYRTRSDDLAQWASEMTATPPQDGNDKSESPACRWARDLSALYLFLATVLEFFTDDLPLECLEVAEKPQAGLRSLDHLAAARQAMSVNTAVTVKYIQGFQNAWQADPAGPDTTPHRAKLASRGKRSPRSQTSQRRTTVRERASTAALRDGSGSPQAEPDVPNGARADGETPLKPS